MRAGEVFDPPDYGHGVASDYLYPLEQTGREFVVNGRAATPDVMEKQARSGEHSSYLLSTGFSMLGRGDRIWFRAGAGERRVVAVGIVQTTPYQGTDDGRWRAVVALNHKATQRLQKAKQRPHIRAVRQAVWRASVDEVEDLLEITGTEVFDNSDGL
jgi:hypothetical protein